MTVPPPDHRRSPADAASCSALAARLQQEAATLTGVLTLLSEAGADRRVVRELADVIADVELLAHGLQRYVTTQARARSLSAQRAVSEEGRGRHALLSASRRVRRLPGKYGDVP